MAPEGAELAHHYQHLYLKMSDGLDINNSPCVHAEKASVEVDHGVRDDQSRGRRNDHGDAVSALEAVGHLYAMDDMIKQISFVSDKH